MAEPREIAIQAVKKMRAELGPNAQFPGDLIWLNVDTQVPSERRPPTIVWLGENGYIEKTGRMVNAATEDRKGSPTTEYRFGPKLRPASASSISQVASKFSENCNGILEITDGQILRFCASLLAKRFLILTGLAGSGKTKLAQAFAHWITSVPANTGDSNPYYSLVPVGADWTGSENVVGYPNGLDSATYMTKPALELIRHAIEGANTNSPHFLILDEMNLSHVERYFADVLSAIESEEEIPLYQGETRRAGGKDVPQAVQLPENVFVIGTVNVDETTYMFSPKVLDRANVIEFRVMPEELGRFLGSPKAPNLEALEGKGASFGKGFVKAASDKSIGVPDSVKVEYEKEMLLFFNLLRGHNAEFGYRVAYESARFLHFYKLLGGYPDSESDWFRAAMDSVIVQKFLPKLHGSRSRLEGLLWALAWACGAERKERDGKDFADQLHEASQADDEVKYGPEVIWAEVARANSSEPVKAARYPLSFDKVMRMWRQLVRDQFVTFAES